MQEKQGIANHLVGPLDRRAYFSGEALVATRILLEKLRS